MIAILIGFLGLLLATPAPAPAHDLGVIRGEMVEISHARYTLELELAAGLAPGAVSFPDRCQSVAEPVIRPRQGFTLMSLELTCGDEPLNHGDTIRLTWPSDGAFVQARWLDADGAGHFFEGTDQGIVLDVDRLKHAQRPAAEVAWHYSRFGVEHILSGWDHLAFVLGLFLIARGWALVGRVTAFTAGHSLSLILAVLGWVKLPGPPVEACIALSIAFLAREALVTRSEGRDSSRHAGWGLIFGFGLLHGLGFAGALTESGIVGSERFLGLLTFNLGVELGQLLFVLGLMAIVALGSRLPVQNLAPRGVAYALGILGIFWTVERLVSFSTLA